MVKKVEPQKTQRGPRIHPFYVLLLLAGMAVCVWYLWRMQGARLPDFAALIARVTSAKPLRTRYVTPQVGWGTDATGRTLYRTKDGGKTWTIVRRFHKETLGDFQFFDDQSGFALLEGSVYKTTDGGRRWQRVFTAPEDRPIQSLLFSTPRAGRFLDSAGLAWHTHDGGRTWQSDKGQRVSEHHAPGPVEVEPEAAGDQQASARVEPAPATPPPAKSDKPSSTEAPAATPTLTPAPSSVPAQAPAPVQTRGQVSLPAMPPPSPQSADARQRLERATALYERGDYEGVLTTLEPIEHPTASVATLRGWAYYRRNEITYAKRSFIQARSLDPESVQAQNGEAYCLYREYRYADADKIFRDVLTRAPQNVDALIGTGLIAYYNGHYPEAEEIFTRVLRLAPQNKEVLDYLQRARERRGPGD